MGSKTFRTAGRQIFCQFHDDKKDILGKDIVSQVCDSKELNDWRKHPLRFYFFEDSKYVHAHFISFY